MSPDIIYFPIDTEESAHFGNSDNLLPQKLYKDLSGFIKEALDQVKPAYDGNKKYRSHHAVLVDGERGTGKTSVLVNLPAYLEKNNETKSFFNDLMILEPIDPTLLEDGDSLFLTIIVASILSNQALKEKQKRSPEKTAELNRALDRLATALESAEPDSDAKGMQKIRNMYDNHNLETCVRGFFDTVLQLMEKKLLVLPIDDVDTSLNRAFENLEIVRRYLTSPNVLPIIAGDLKLYQEVIWRDFHGRMTKESNYDNEQAFDTAQELAHEYQRKVMPHSRRLVMPDVETYLGDPKDSPQIKLLKGQNHYMSLANFHAWLEIFIAGPVNGLEGSALPIPIKSIRALTQLLNRCQVFIPELPIGITEAANQLQAKRSWQMANVDSNHLDEFYQDFYQQSREAKEKRRYGSVYIAFENKQKPKEVRAISASQSYKWEQTLASHFIHEEEAGALSLVLKAREDWYKVSNTSSVLNSPIFQPLLHKQREWAGFRHNSNLDDWQKELHEKLPAAWLQKHKNSTTILPYPLPQVGSPTKVDWQREQSYKDNKDTLLTLLTNYNFYSDSNQSRMLNSGRIFEIMIHSLVAPLDVPSLQRIAHQAPFYSTSDLAPTKTLTLEAEADDGVSGDDFDEQDISGLIVLSDEIKEWRQNHKLELFRLSPWLVYKVFNKVFSQMTHFPDIGKKNDEAYMKASLDLLALTFNSTWAAFASFEKGPLFGLPVKVATTNINPDSSKEFQANAHFKTNISPFTPQLEPLLNLRKQQKEGVDGANSEAKARDAFGRCTNTVTHMLADHPLRKWINDILGSHKEKLDEPVQLNAPQNEVAVNRTRYDRLLKSEYNLNPPAGADVTKYTDWIQSIEDGLAKCERVLEETREVYHDSSIFKVLDMAVVILKELGEKE
ncbi:antiviral RADAR system adenosine triphosphatase RdrA [Vibrio lentus]